MPVDVAISSLNARNSGTGALNREKPQSKQIKSCGTAPARRQQAHSLQGKSPGSPMTPGLMVRQYETIFASIQAIEYFVSDRGHG
jgi:hypothetical protein